MKLKSKVFFKSLLANETVAGINKKFGSAHENGPWSYTVGTMHVRNIYKVYLTVGEIDMITSCH